MEMDPGGLARAAHWEEVTGRALSRGVQSRWKVKQVSVKEHLMV